MKRGGRGYVQGMTSHQVSGAPPLPPGRTVELPGRGTTFIWEAAGPPGADTLILLHGLGAGADVNWYPAFAPLARQFHVLALDDQLVPVRRQVKLVRSLPDSVAAFVRGDHFAIVRNARKFVPALVAVSTRVAARAHGLPRDPSYWELARSA